MTNFIIPKLFLPQGCNNLNKFSFLYDFLSQ